MRRRLDQALGLASWVVIGGIVVDLLRSPYPSRRQLRREIARAQAARFVIECPCCYQAIEYQAGRGAAPL